MSMVFCWKCGKQVDEEHDFCIWCGARNMALYREGTCPNCGAEMQSRTRLKSTLGPYSFNPLGYMLGMVGTKEHYRCPRCGHEESME